MILCPHCGERIDFVAPAGLTPVQADVLAVIRRLLNEKGYSPSYREIAEGVGRKSIGHLTQIIDGLEQRGYIRRLPNRSRSIQIISGGKAA